MPRNGLDWAMDVIVLSISGVLAVVYGLWFSPRGSSWPKTAVKTASVALLALVAWIYGGPLLLVAGLILGALGDFWLSREGDRAFLIGLVSFALGHLAYIGLLWQFGAVLQSNVYSIAIVLLACGMAVILWPRAGGLRVPVTGYVTIIAVMGVLAFGLPQAWWLGAIAALSFVVSDAILACELFVLSKSATIRPVTSRLVWITYFAAQAMFLAAFGGQMPL